MSSRHKRKRPGMNRSALKSAAAKRSNALKRTPASAARAEVVKLPRGLEARLVDIEARLAVVEQLRICPMACRGESCAFRCPTEVTR